MQQTKNQAIKNDYQMNEEIAQKIIDLIESGDVQEWRKTWTTTSSLNIKNIYALVCEGIIAMNLYSLQQYNPLIVPSGVYVTFKQIKSKKLHLQKGAKGIPNYKFAIYVKYLTKNERLALETLLESDAQFNEKYNKLLDGKIEHLRATFNYIDNYGNEKKFDEVLMYNNQDKQLFYKNHHYVLEYLFNITDCGLTLEDVRGMWKVNDEKTEEIKNLTPNEIAENIKLSYIERTNLTYTEEYQNDAFYITKTHSVTLPLKNQFETVEDYYQTMFHEFAHSTGHPSLLNRPTLTETSGYSSLAYSKEELIAELSSLYTMISLNLINDDLLKNSIAYLRGWGEDLKEGIRHNILSTIAQARKATNLILNIQD